MAENISSPCDNSVIISALIGAVRRVMGLISAIVERGSEITLGSFRCASESLTEMMFRSRDEMAEGGSEITPDSVLLPRPGAEMDERGSEIIWGAVRRVMGLISAIVEGGSEITPGAVRRVMGLISAIVERGSEIIWGSFRRASESLSEMMFRPRAVMDEGEITLDDDDDDDDDDAAADDSLPLARPGAEMDEIGSEITLDDDDDDDDDDAAADDSVLLPRPGAEMDEIGSEITLGSHKCNSKELLPPNMSEDELH